jgi:hypothetical protein
MAIRRFTCVGIIASTLVLLLVPGSSAREGAESDPTVSVENPVVQEESAPIDESAGLPESPAEASDETDPTAKTAPEDPEAPASDPMPDRPAIPAPLAASDQTNWAERVLALTERIDLGLSEPEQADALYHELAAELWTFQDEVYEGLRSRSPDALDQRARLAEMYAARVRLLETVTPGLRMKLLGGNTDGMRELRREFANAKLDLGFQTLAIPRGLRQIVDNVRESPLDDLWRLLQLLFGVVVFRSWRRWAKTGLNDARMSILAIRPRTEVHVQVARLLWYLNKFRGPLEWLALLFFASAIFEPGDLEEVSILAWVILLWTLLTRFGLLLVDALASQGANGASGRTPGLRHRSLRLVAAWILLTGLGLDLTSRYVGEAAIHAWVTRAFLFLLVPVLLLLLHWWRTEIIYRLKTDASFSPTARRMGKREKGFGSYVNAAAGALYVVGAELLQLSIRLASRFEAGRKIVATLLRREVERDAQREHVAEERISEELVLQLLTPDDTIIEGPLLDGIARVKELIRTGRGGSIAVLAERGGGLSTFFRLLEKELSETIRVIDCPPGGPEKFVEAITSAFGLTKGADLKTELRPRLDTEGVRIVALDNYHRVSRPRRGGLEGMMQAAEVSQAAGGDILWIVSLTRASWPYIKGMLGDRAILQEILELPAWSEAQLEQLFDARCEKAGIQPDYRRLDFPRQFDDGERATLEERNRFGFRRVLWELSDGNPEVAIRLFADSLRELPNGNVIVRLPQPATSNKIASANRTTMLILKILVETELATIDDLRACIREQRDLITNALAYCVQQGWVEEVYDHYQIKWSAYRTVKRVLVRRGLIAR